MNRLERLRQAGVSVWLDTLSRELLDSGELERLVGEYAVTGATSNPTIFAKAITESDRYDQQLGAVVESGTTDPRDIFFELGLEDVSRAARILYPAHERSCGRDGFVSFECTPDVSDDPEATIARVQVEAGLRGLGEHPAGVAEVGNEELLGCIRLKLAAVGPGMTPRMSGSLAASAGERPPASKLLQRAEVLPSDRAAQSRASTAA